MNSQQEQSRSVARLTPRGRGAVATLRLIGDEGLLSDIDTSFFRAANQVALDGQPIGRVCFGHWGTDATQEEVVVCRIDATTTEIHCHGGDVAVARIVDDLKIIGCRNPTWQEMIACTNSRFDAECADVLARTTTLRTATIVLEQTSGILKREFHELRQLGNREWTDDVRNTLSERIKSTLRWYNIGLHLTRPWSVVLAGRPNVGKSSLINALVGYSRSIVYDQPGTTRDVVTAETALEGWPVRFSDTAGIRDEAGQLESAGIELARNQLANADCQVLLIDTSEPPHSDDRRLMDQHPDALLVANKTDLANRWGTELPARAIHVSALTGDGVGKLIARIIDRLVPEHPLLNSAIPLHTRHVDFLKTVLAAVQNDRQEEYVEAIKAFK